jgi:hypothetical protein
VLRARGRVARDQPQDLERAQVGRAVPDPRLPRPPGWCDRSPPRQDLRLLRAPPGGGSWQRRRRPRTAGRPAGAAVGRSGRPRRAHGHGLRRGHRAATPRGGRRGSRAGWRAAYAGKSRATQLPARTPLRRAPADGLYARLRVHRARRGPGPLWQAPQGRGLSPSRFPGGRRGKRRRRTDSEVLGLQHDRHPSLRERKVASDAPEVPDARGGAGVRGGSGRVEHLSRRGPDPGPDLPRWQVGRHGRPLPGQGPQGGRTSRAGADADRRGTLRSPPLVQPSAATRRRLSGRRPVRQDQR